jgi:hypothetical protein
VLTDVWQRESPPRQRGGLRCCGRHGNVGALLDEEAGSSAMPFVMASKQYRQLYKSCASQSGLKGAEVVVEMAPLSGGEITMHEMGVTT